MNIVGITSCIAGLAHTPMAAKALEKAGDKLGHNVKIEQQGAMGIVNELKSQDIENAEVVIIAADKVIDGEDRFKNKTVVITGTMSKSRDEIKLFLEDLGAKVSSSISKKTDFLIYGEDAGSKYDKAIEFGIEILTEDEMYSKI